MVNKFTAIVRIYPEQLNGQSLPNFLNGFKYMYLRLVYHSDLLGPARRNIGHVQCKTILSFCCAAIVPHQVHLKESWARLIPIRKGSNGNLVLQQGSRLGVVYARFKCVLVSFAL